MNEFWTWAVQQPPELRYALLAVLRAESEMTQAIGHKAQLRAAIRYSDADVAFSVALKEFGWIPAPAPVNGGEKATG